jgi:hypothetical protein
MFCPWKNTYINIKYIYMACPKEKIYLYIFDLSMDKYIDIYGSSMNKTTDKPNVALTKEIPLQIKI